MSNRRISAFSTLNATVLSVVAIALLGSCQTDPAVVCRAVAAPGVYTGCQIIQTGGWGCGEGEFRNVVRTTNARNEQVTLDVCCNDSKGCTIRVH